MSDESSAGLDREPRCCVCAKRPVADHSAAYCEQCGEIKENNDRFARLMRALLGDRRE